MNYTNQLTNSYNPNQSSYTYNQPYSSYQPCGPCVQPPPCANPPPPQRYIQKVPYQKKIIEYEQYTYQEQVPRQVTRTQIDEVKRIEYVPVQKKITDYYAVQIQKKYVPKYVPEKTIEMVPMEKISQKINYKPKQRQVVHNKPPQLDMIQGSSNLQRVSSAGNLAYGTLRQINQNRNKLLQEHIGNQYGTIDKSHIPTTQRQYGTIGGKGQIGNTRFSTTNQGNQQYPYYK